MYGIPAIEKNDSPIDRSLQRLAGAVLIQALQDASSGPRRAREEALEWIQGRSTSRFSFSFCCGILGRDQDDVLQRLQRFAFMPRSEDGSSSFYGASMGAFSSGD